jgi:hypothetical protein
VLLCRPEPCRPATARRGRENFLKENYL